MIVKERKFAALVEYLGKVGDEYMLCRKIVSITNCNICGIIELADSLSHPCFKPTIEIIELEN